MQKVWEVLDDTTGVVKITLTADNTVQGVTISNSPDWQSVTDLTYIASLIGTAITWLQANEGVA